jgi:hypothetical protein
VKSPGKEILARGLREVADLAAGLEINVRLFLQPAVAGSRFALLRQRHTDPAATRE